MTNRPLDHSRTHLVNRYFTPLGVLLVANGIILAELPLRLKAVSSVLMVFSILFNSLSIGWIDHGDAAGRRLRVRVWVNFAVSVLQVYIFGPAWPPAWLLLILTPIASAIYGSRGNTILFSFLASAAILVVHALRGPSGPIGWAVQVNCGAFIILLSLGLYALSRIVRAEARHGGR
ncbi:MAG: hypothetical protein NTY77_02240 [Elusimicrobia bacterium]|nr:hypothetical protein [Elusimicrobiota bacterium]